MSAIRVLAIVAGACALFASCLVNRKTVDFECDEQSDCDAGRVCSGGFCVVGVGGGLTPDGPLVQCPAQCNGGCNLTASTCAIDCLAGSCGNVACPAGFACTIQCGAANACSAVDCSNATSCAIACTGTNACGNVTCGLGRCDVSCSGNNACGIVQCSQSCQCDVACGGGTDCSATSCPTRGSGCTDGTAAGCDSTPSGCATTCPAL